MVRQQRQSGQALVAATFGLVVLLGAAGLAIDMGYLRYQRRLQQSAADSAALAGAAESAAGNATTAAREDASLNGFTNGVNHVTVNVNAAFPFGTFTGVQVQVSAIQPTFFMRIFGVNSATVSTTAVALNSSAKNCIYALEGGTGITNSGTLNAKLATPGCGIVDDGNLFNTNTINAESVAVHGTVAGAPTNPAAVAGIVPAGDPLFRLTAPATGGGCQANPNIAGAGTSVNVNPAKYCTGITIGGSKNVTLNAGTYVITGGGITFSGTGSITGTDVTFYVAGGQISINSAPGSARTLLLTAPTTGTLAGILFYQNTGNALAATINGNGTARLQGALYFPGATLNLSNTGALAAYTIAVAKSLALSGTVDFPNNYSSLPAGSPIKNAVLVE